MSFKNDGNMKTWCFVADSQAVSLRPAAGVQVDRTTLPAGTVALVDRQNKVLATMPATGEVKFAYGLGAGKAPIITAPMDVTKMTFTKAKNVTQVEQVTYVGYAGSGTENLSVANDTYYHMLIQQTQNDTKHRGNNHIYDITGSYKSPVTGATVPLLAIGLRNSLLANAMKFETEIGGVVPGYLKPELTADGTVADFTGTATMIKLTKGSKVAEFVDAAGAASTGTAAVGNIFNIPTSSGRSFTYTASANAVVLFIGSTLITVADAGTAAQNAAAQVAAINASGLAGAEAASDAVTIHTLPCQPIPVPAVYDSTATAFIAVTVASGDAVPTKLHAATAASAAASFEFDSPYLGETGYFVGGTTVATMIGVNSAPTIWGLKLTGIKEDFSHITWKDFNKNTFVVAARKGSVDAGWTIATPTKASTGVGTYEKVAGLEYASMVDNSIGTLPTYIPNEAPTMFSNACGRYSLINIGYTNSIDSMLGFGGKTFWNVTLALELDSANNLISGSQGDQLAETVLTTGFTTGDLDA